VVLIRPTFLSYLIGLASEVSSNVYGFFKTIDGTWINIDGIIKNVSGTLKNVNGTFKSTSLELLKTSTYIIKHHHLVIHKFEWCWKHKFWRLFNFLLIDMPLCGRIPWAFLLF
jgi:hypothetical protein